MVPPGVLARVEKSHGSLRPRVDTAEIRPFIQVTAITGEAEIGRIVVTAVLLRNNVLDVERNVDRILWQSAVLATLTGSLSDQVANSGVYHEGHLARNVLAFAFRMPRRSMLSTNSSYSARSASESVPSFAFSRSSSMRAWVAASGRSSATRWATSGVRQSVNGSRNRSRTPAGEFMV